MELILESCPHCGGIGKLRVDDIKIQGKEERVAWVYCTNCKCRTNYFRYRYNSDYKDRAAVAWNMRIDDDGEKA